MKAFFILFRNLLSLFLIVFTLCFIQSCNQKAGSGNTDNQDSTTNEISENVHDSISSRPPYTMINMPSFRITGAVFRQLLINAATIVDSLQAEITVDASGNATVTFYRWNNNIKTAIPGNFTPHSSYPLPLFESSSPLRCKNGLSGIHFAPTVGVDYFLVPDVFTPPGQALVYPRYRIKTTDSDAAPQVTSKMLNPIPPGISVVPL